MIYNIHKLKKNIHDLQITIISSLGFMVREEMRSKDIDSTIFSLLWYNFYN